MTQSEHLFRALVYIEDLLDEEKVAQACQLCIQLLDQFPNDSDLLFVYAIALQLNNQQKKAISILKRLTLMIPESCETWNHLSLLLFEERNFFNAQEALDRALALESQNAFSWWLYSILRLFRGESTKAKRSYLYAQWLEPEIYTPHRSIKKEELVNTLKQSIALLSPQKNQYCTSLIWNVCEIPTNLQLEQLQLSPLQPLVHIERSQATLHIFRYNIENLKKEAHLLIPLLKEEISYILRDTAFPYALA